MAKRIESRRAVRLCCTCGATWSMRGIPDAGAARIREAFLNVHSGPGHRLCDAAAASRARRKP